MKIQQGEQSSRKLTIYILAQLTKIGPAAGALQGLKVPLVKKYDTHARSYHYFLLLVTT